jgi:hypothetical protein
MRSRNTEALTWLVLRDSICDEAERQAKVAAYEENKKHNETVDDWLKEVFGINDPEDASSKKEAANNFFADAEGKVTLVVAKTEGGSTLVKTGRASCTATCVDHGIIEISDGEDSIKKQLASLVVFEEKKKEYVDIITVSD